MLKCYFERDVRHSSARMEHQGPWPQEGERVVYIMTRDLLSFTKCLDIGAVTGLFVFPQRGPAASSGPGRRPLIKNVILHDY